MATTNSGQAVRRWRDRGTPGTAGLPAGGHRRAAGLRREELALPAGICADYLTCPEHRVVVKVISIFP